MAASVTHAFTSAIADDPTAQAAGEVLPSHWNAGHTVSGVYEPGGTDVAVADGGTGASTAAGAAANLGVIPIADLAGAYIDTTTYDDTLQGSGKLRTLVLPQNQTFLAVAIEGDDYPRWIFNSDATDGIYLGNGTFDPYSGGVAIVMTSGGGNNLLLLEGGNGNIQIGAGNANTGGYSFSSFPFAFGNGLVIGAKLSSGYGAPTRGGDVGDIYIDATGTTPADMLYRCTVAGTAGNATWALMFATGQTYAASNVTTDRSYDANSTTLDEVADVLGTLIADLRAIGLVA